jgi:hypothetical protein
MAPGAGPPVRVPAVCVHTSKLFHLLDEDEHRRPCGPMDKASAYGTGDCRFESCQGQRTAPTVGSEVLGEESPKDERARSPVPASG